MKGQSRAIVDQNPLNNPMGPSSWRIRLMAYIAPGGLDDEVEDA